MAEWAISLLQYLIMLRTSHDRVGSNPRKRCGVNSHRDPDFPIAIIYGNILL